MKIEEKEELRKEKVEEKENIKLEENNNEKIEIKKKENKEEVKGEKKEKQIKNETVKEKKKDKQESENKKEDKKNKEIENEQKEESKNETFRKYNNYDVKTKTKTKKSKKIIIISIIIFILLLVTLFSTGFALLNINNDKVLAGISIRNIDIGGLNKEEATQLLKDKLEYEKSKELKLHINGENTSITLEQLEVEYLIEEAVEKAYNIGRDGNIFENNFAILKSIHTKQDIDLNITYSEQLLDDIINGINAKIPNAMIDNTYNVEDDELIITRGTPGLILNKEKSKELIVNALKNGLFEDIELEATYIECPDIDIDKIYNEVHTEPKNAYYTTEPFQIYPHENGIDFDLEAARQTIEQEEKEEYVIELKITKPDILTNEIGTEAFPNLLSSFSTKYDETNVSRSTNLKLATGKINGAVVMPGEVFSYNKTVGKRTVEAGYKNANGFAGGRVVQMLGGGICQVSSTLYDAVVYANLNIVERHNHMFQATYVEPGKDATVVYGSLDFKFENTRNYPVMIKATASGGLLDIKIYGVKEEVEYDIDIVTKVLSYTPYSVIYEDDASLAPGEERVAQYGIQGCKSITYKIVKLNGTEVENTVLSSDTYDPQNKIIKRGPTVETSAKPETEKEDKEEEKKEEKEETPTTPTTPVAPETPTTPTEPTTPTTPTTPVEPTAPTTPAEPTTPVEPSTPTEPETPTTPTEPENPVDPEIPTTGEETQTPNDSE